MKALVLGGGSLKGAWQVGVIRAVLEDGFQPDMIYGISVGGLNSSFLVNEATKQHIEHKHIDWLQLSQTLIEFWVKNITKPEDIAEMRSKLTLGIDTIMSRFDGLLDNTPLRRLMNHHLDEFILRNSPIQLKVGAVDVISGEMVYASPKEPNFFDYVIASSSLPTLMPTARIGGDHRTAFLDGGVREVVPIKEALKDGATELVCIACHPAKVETANINYHNFLKLYERVKDITINQFVNSDIAWAESYVEKENLKGNRLTMKVIRPSHQLNLDLLSFNSDDIARLIVQGFKEGYESLSKKS
jgi:NTE family protein